MKIRRQKYIDELNKWWEGNRKEALFVLGVKNIGKTELVRDWANEKGINFNYFDEELYSEIKEIFNDSTVKSFDTSLAIVNKMMFQSIGELLIFDGIRPKDEIIVQIKKLCSTSNKRYILISDFNDYVFEDARFYPVGSLKILKIEPIDFSEYCHIRLNPYMIESAKMVALNEENKPIPFSEKFESVWEDYLNYGGFPSVVAKLIEQGYMSARDEIERFKLDILSFVRENINYSANLCSLFENLSNKRSTTYNRFVFNSISATDTYQRYKRAISILVKLGIINFLPFKGESLFFEYCDLYFCDPGFESLSDEIGKNHIIESVLCSFGIKKGYKVARYVLENSDKTIDLVYEDLIPYFLDIKLKNTNSKELSAQKYKDFIMTHSGTVKPFVLVDKGLSFVETISKARIMPVWVFLLSE